MKQRNENYFFCFGSENADFFANRSEGTKIVPRDPLQLNRWNAEGTPDPARKGKPTGTAAMTFFSLPITAEQGKRATNRVLSRAVFSIARQGDDRDLGEQ